MKRIIIGIGFCTLLLAGCSKDTTEQKTQVETTCKIEEKKNTGAWKTKPEDFKLEEIMENAPKQEEDGTPYMNTGFHRVTYEGYHPELKNPWDFYDFYDSVIRLTVEDMKGSKTFFDGDVYSFIDKDGRKELPARLPVGDRDPEIVHLYMSKTNVTEKLKEGDVLALEAVFNYPDGAMVKVIHADTKGEVVHLATICPQPYTELWESFPTEKK